MKTVFFSLLLLTGGLVGCQLAGTDPLNPTPAKVTYLQTNNPVEFLAGKYQAFGLSKNATYYTEGDMSNTEKLLPSMKSTYYLELIPNADKTMLKAVLSGKGTFGTLSGELPYYPVYARFSKDTYDSWQLRTSPNSTDIALDVIRYFGTDHTEYQITQTLRTSDGSIVGFNFVRHSPLVVKR